MLYEKSPVFNPLAQSRNVWAWVELDFSVVFIFLCDIYNLDSMHWYMYNVKNKKRDRGHGVLSLFLY